MKIQKFLHSCIRVESDGARILFDPGANSFLEKLVAPKELAPVDAVLYTHSHGDHFSPEALREIVAACAPKIFAPAEIAAAVRELGFECEEATPGSTLAIGGFRIEVLDAPHEKLPFPVPANVGYLVDGKVLLPGDSFGFALPEGIELIALPYISPFSTIGMATDCALRVKPRFLLPVHDSYLKDFWRAGQEDRLRQVLEPQGIAVRPLKLGEELALA